MKSLEQVIQSAQAQGLLPAEAAAPTQDARPWPVVLLTAIGAWFAAVPLILVVGLLFGGLLNTGPGSYFVGGLVLCGAVIVLRSSSVALFAEQLAVPALLVGGGTLAMGLFRDLNTAGAAGVLSLLACAIAWMTPRTWLRVLLGAAASGLVVLALLPTGSNDMWSGFMHRVWLAWQLSMAAWLAFHWFIANRLLGGDKAQAALALEAFSTGWVLATLLGLALWSGMTFLLGASVQLGAGAHAGNQVTEGWSGTLIRLCSVLLTIAAAGWLALKWPTVRQPWLAAAAVIIAGLAWQLPSLGAVICILAFCVSSGRTKLAAAAALAAAWIMGSYYYQLQYPLDVKALRLIGGGAVLGALAWFGAGKDMLAIAKASMPSHSRGIGIAVGLVLVLVVANGAIWQKEKLIANGNAVFVELAPVDPRSIMQGDFMQLNYRLPLDANAMAASKLGADRPHVVAQPDARGVATLMRMHDGKGLGKDEFLIELTPHQRGWTLVSDAWFFKEGEAQRWAKAKYGEFRVTPDGRALLVGLRGPNLEKL
jgi:uncharacterized membrane-anchored protein